MTTSDFGELGSTGLRKQAGIVQEEFLRELQGWRWHKTLREMQQDPIIGAILLAIEMLLRQVEVNVEPADDTPEAQELAEFVESCLFDMSLSWPDTLAEILTMLPWGWSYLELVYKRRQGDNRDPSKRSKHTDGRIGWRKWAIRAQETLDRWEFDNEGGVQGLWQAQESGPPILIPIEKALLFRTTAHKGNPEGRSILRTAYRPWYMKTNIENIEGIGVERDLAGLPVAKVPPELLSSNATAEQRALLNSIKEIVVNIRRDEQEGVVWPLAYDGKGNEMFKLELLASSGQRQFDTDKIIARYDQRIAMSVLADFILLGHEQVGSYALSATKTSLFQAALEAWLKGVAGVINAHAIPRLLRLNGMNTLLAPAVSFGAVGDVSLEELMQFVQVVAGAGGTLFPDFELENHLRGRAGLPLLDEEDFNEREAGRRREIEPVSDGEPGEGQGENGPMSSEEMRAMLQAAQRILARGG